MFIKFILISITASARNFEPKVTTPESRLHNRDHVNRILFQSTSYCENPGRGKIKIYDSKTKFYRTNVSRVLFQNSDTSLEQREVISSTYALQYIGHPTSRGDQWSICSPMYVTIRARHFPLVPNN